MTNRPDDVYPMSGPITAPMTQPLFERAVLDMLFVMQNKLDLIIRRLERDGGPLS